MAGSYNHCVTYDGSLRSPEDLAEMLENGGDVYEAVEEMYGMIWWLAHLIESDSAYPMADIVEGARDHYKEGVDLSPTDRPALF